MAFSLVPTTELDAINVMVTSIGEAPVSTLTGTGSISVETARKILHEVNREVQSRGWSFNRETDFEISPTSSDEIEVPSNVLRIDPSLGQYLDLVWRGSRMYDKGNHTYTITDTVKFDIVWFLDFTDLPETARRYITIRAARIMQDRTITSGTQHDFTTTDEMWARVALEDADSEAGDRNIFKGDIDLMRITERFPWR